MVAPSSLHCFFSRILPHCVRHTAHPLLLFIHFTPPRTTAHTFLLSLQGTSGKAGAASAQKAYSDLAGCMKHARPLAARCTKHLASLKVSSIDSFIFTYITIYITRHDCVTCGLLQVNVG